MKIVVVGTGYVGLVTGACLADVGHQVTCVDIDQQKIDLLKAGTMPFYEPGLDSVVKNNTSLGRLLFSTDLAQVLKAAEVIFIAVGTPSLPDGRANLQYVYTVADSIGEYLDHYAVVVDKSTVPVGTAAEVEARIQAKYSGEFSVVSCPEFLREGYAVEDFMHPDRIVFGAKEAKAFDVMADVFKPIKGEKLHTSVESAELIKYASNAFLATKISFINEIAHVCELAGADVDEVAYGIGLDSRIGPKFLQAGIGWGGSCFPKDVAALHQTAGSHGYDFKLLKSVIEVNQHQRIHFLDKIKKHFKGDLQGKRFAVLGLAFKNNTDDIRESAALDIIRLLWEAGAEVVSFDYKAADQARAALGEQLSLAQTPEEAMSGADAVIITTEWKQFKDLPWAELKNKLIQPVIFDGRNLLHPKKMRELGFTYVSIGRNHS